MFLKAKIKNNKHWHNSSLGLTIVESLVSMAILSLGLVPILSVISNSFQLSSVIRNNLIAANLSQEGVEIARSLRDSNWFSSAPNFYDNLIGTWKMDFDTDLTGNPPQATTAQTNTPILFDSNSGLYNYTVGTDTLFKRLISISLSANTCNCELIVVSEVSWDWRGQTRTVKSEAVLYDWW